MVRLFEVSLSRFRLSSENSTAAMNMNLAELPDRSDFIADLDRVTEIKRETEFPEDHQ
jgi:hypothetical protein